MNRSFFVLKNLIVIICCGMCGATCAMSPLYRQAHDKDLDALVQLYSHMDESGRNNVVVYPRQIIAGVIGADIAHGKMFVATQDQEIVSALKVCSLDDKKEREAVLVDELNIGKEKNFEEVRVHTCGTRGVEDTKIDTSANAHACFVRDIMPLVHKDTGCTNLYYGRAYTLAEYRGKGVCTGLLRYALNSVLSTLKKQGETVTLAYGLVNANRSHAYMLKPLVECLGGLNKGTRFVAHQGVYTAYRPDLAFNEDTQEVQAIFPEKNKGCGNLVVVRLLQQEK